MGSAIGHPVLLELVRTGSSTSAPGITNPSGVPSVNNERGNKMGGGMGRDGGGGAQQNNLNRNGMNL